jgi:tetratricopeptide (TPR) repeat protein
LITGCSVKTPDVKVGKKSFENEDLLIVQALEFRKNRDYESAIGVYNTLYEQSKKTNYLIEAAKISFLTNNNEKTHQLVATALKENPKDTDIRRILIGLYMKENNVEDAKKEVLRLLEMEKNSRNLTIAGTIYFQLKSYELSLKYFQSAYKESVDENVLLNMVDVLYNYLGKKDEAISYLETHIRLEDCGTKVCYKLIEIYGKERDIDGIISTYKKMYERFQDEEYAKKVVELLVYKKDKSGAVQFLDKTGYNQEMLLDIYVSSSDFDGAYKVAQRLYEKYDEMKYLGQMAIYEYEKNKKNLNEDILKSVSQKFEKVVSQLENPLFLNYYGYLLIDHDMDITKGIDLVKKALKEEPNSVFYLDSLAWGLYKLGDCIQAKQILDKFINNVEEEEVMMHYNKIKECLQK